MVKMANCVCVCACMCVYMCVYVYVYMYVYMCVHVCLCIFVCVYVYVYMCVYVSMCVYMCVYMRVCVCLCVCTTLCLEHTSDCAVHPPTCGACVWTHTSAVSRAPCAVTLEASRPYSLLPPPSRVPLPPKFRDSVTTPPQERSQRGESSPGEGAEKGGLGSGAPVATPVCPAPAPFRSLAPLSLPTHQGRLSRKAPMCRGGCLWLLSPLPHFPALRLLSLPFCQAQPRWEIPLGIFTPHRVLIA